MPEALVLEQGTEEWNEAMSNLLGNDEENDLHPFEEELGEALLRW